MKGLTDVIKPCGKLYITIIIILETKWKKI